MSVIEEYLYKKNRYLALAYVVTRNIKNNIFFIHDELCLKHEFKKKLNRNLNLNKPEYYNDKIQKLKLNMNSQLASLCVDKYECRDYIGDVIGNNYLNIIYGVFESVDEINFKKLPQSFVLKCTHGSGMNIVCKNKSKLDINFVKNKIWCWMNVKYHLFNKEYVYKNVRPRIVCEKFLCQDDNDELRDYRFFCFNGKVEFIAVDFHITNKQHTKRNLYDLEWNLMDEEISYPKNKDCKLKKPENLSEMIILAEKLSKHFQHVRVDFYNINKKIIFGEMTFFHQSGCGIFKPLSFEKRLGSLISV